MFILLRHGETDYNVEGRYQGGSNDPHLTPRGQEQIRAAALILKNFRIGKVFCSPLKRTYETLQILKSLDPNLSTSFIESQALTEPSIPEWIGMFKSRIHETETLRLALWRERPWEFSCLDKTRPLELLYDRIKDFVESIRDIEEDVLVIGHDHVNRSIISTLLELPVDAHVKIPQKVAALTAISKSIYDRRLSLAFANLRKEVRSEASKSSLTESPTLLLMRHGRTEANDRDVFQGNRLDIDLSKESADQVLRLKESVTELRPRVILCSVLKRAVTTAKFLNLDVPIIEDQGLNEFDYGLWTGKTRVQVRQTYQEEYRSWLDLATNRPISSGETLDHFVLRVQRVLDLAWHYAGAKGRVLVISHEIVLRMLVVLSLGLPRQKFWQFDFDHLAFSEISENERRQPVLIKHNLHLSDVVE